MKEEKNKQQPQATPDDNITEQAYDFIMDGTVADNAGEGVSDCEIEQANELLNPDPESMGSRG